MRLRLALLGLVLFAAAACSGGGDGADPGAEAAAPPAAQAELPPVEPAPEAELPSAEPSPVAPGRGEPDLGAIALGLADLPAGVTIDNEGFAETENAKASYQRNFDPLEARFGGSRLVDLESAVAEFESAEQAAGSLEVLRTILTGGSAVEFFRDIIGAGAGFDPGDLQGETSPIRSSETGR